MVVQDVAEIVVGRGQAGIERNSLPVCCFRFVVAAERAKYDTKIGMVRRVDAYGAQQDECLGMPSRPVGDDAEQTRGGTIIRVVQEGGLACLLR
jgi:hypothetical protein